MAQGKTIPDLDPASFNPAFYLAIANPVTKEAFYIPIASFLSSLNVSKDAVKPYADVVGMLANVDIEPYQFAYVGNAADVTETVGFGLFLYIGGLRDLISSYKLIASAAGSASVEITGSWINRGEFDMSDDNFPDPADFPAIKAYNTWRVSASGEVDFGYGVGPETVPTGSILIAIEDNPGQNGTKWRFI